MPARWELRFENFDRALVVLVEGAKEFRTRDFNVFEQAGLIQHFEMIWELGWKLMRDFLVENGQEVIGTPGTVIRAAFAAGLIENGDGWMEALKLRNRLSHEYDQARAREALDAIVDKHLALFVGLADKLRNAA